MPALSWYHIRLAALAFAVAVAATSAQAQSSSPIYRTTDAQGNVVFTDTPPDGDRKAEPVIIPPTNTAQPVEVPERQGAPEAEAAQDAPAVVITAPADQTTIPMGPGDFSVSASVDPGLESGQRLQLYVDGAPSGGPQTDSYWNLTNVFRGEHQLTVAVLNADGETLTSSEAITVYVLRPSINSPTRKPVPTPRPRAN